MFGLGKRKKKNICNIKVFLMTSFVLCGLLKLKNKQLHNHKPVTLEEPLM